MDIQGFSCVLRNDAAAAIASFRKGSTESPQMRRCALSRLRLDRAAASVDVDLLPYHVPGLTLVVEGIDVASRAGTDFGAGVNVDSILGPAAVPCPKSCGSSRTVPRLTRAGAALLWTLLHPSPTPGPPASGAGSTSPAQRPSTHHVQLN